MGFSDLKKLGKEMTRRVSEGLNVALVVESYDTSSEDPAKHSVTGKRIDNGEQMTISLRPYKGELARARGEPKLWAANSGKMATAIGGVILFERVYKYPEGYSAHWGTSLSHTPEQSEVFIAHACPVVSRNKNYAFDVLRVPAARALTNREELEQALREAFEAATFTFAVVRASDGSGVEVSRVERYRRGFDKLETLSPEGAVKAFLETEFGKTLAKSMGSDFVTEVIPGERVFSGKDTQEKLGEPDHFRRYYKMGEGVGYTPTILAMRRHPEGGVYFTGYSPTSTMPQLFTLEGIASNNIRPKVAPFVNPPQNEAAGDEEETDLASAWAQGDATPEPADKVAEAARALSAAVRR